MSDKRNDALLEQALTEIAMEDTQALKDELARDPDLLHAAETAYARHSADMLFQLRRKQRKPGTVATRFLKIAAAVLILFGSWQLLGQPIKDLLFPPVPLASNAPTVLVTAALHETSAAMTATIIPAVTATAAVTEAPTAAPSATPSPEPAGAPSPVPLLPTIDWPGQYYVPAHAAQYRTLAITTQEDAHLATLTDDRGNAYEYTEYLASVVPPTAAGAQLAYAVLPDGTLALTAVGSQGVQVIWDAGGRTLTVSSPAGLDEALALASVIEPVQ